MAGELARSPVVQVARQAYLRTHTRRDSTMDPNTTLQAMREAWARALDSDDNDEARAEAMADAAEAADSLDQWLSAGGFLPSAWKVAK